MISQVYWNNQWYKADLSKGLDISISISSDGPQSFHSGSAKLFPQRAGDFVGAISMGGSVNSYEVQFIPHAHGTHTECSAHIGLENLQITDVIQTSHFICQLISVEPKAAENGDLIIDQSLLLPELNRPVPPAIIVRTSPNHVSKRKRYYSGSNPPYFAANALAKLADLGVRHFLTDLPSVDKENDGGALLAHKAFWNHGKNKSIATITELIYADSEIEDGTYLLNLQVAAFALDASPSRPVLYQLSVVG